MKLRQFGQLILLIIFASLLSITALAQDESEAKSPLEIKLTARTTAFCVGSPLVLELEVTNNGQKDVSINKSHVWKDFSYAYSARNRERSGGTMTRDENGGGNFILHPAETYRSTYEFALPSDFFQTAGAYRLTTHIDFIYSNEVTFELFDCGVPQEVKEQK